MDARRPLRAASPGRVWHEGAVRSAGTAARNGRELVARRDRRRTPAGIGIPGRIRSTGYIRQERGWTCRPRADAVPRSEEHTSELQSLMRISYDVFCLKKKTQTSRNNSQAYHKINNTVKYTN